MLNLLAMLPKCWQTLSGRASSARDPEISRADRRALADALMQTLTKALHGLGIDPLPTGAEKYPDARRFVRKMLYSDPEFASLYKRGPAQASPEVLARRLIRQRGWTKAFLNEYLLNHAPAQVYSIPRRRVVRSVARPKAVADLPFERAEKLFAAVHTEGSLPQLAKELGGTVARNIETGLLRSGDALRMSHVLNGMGWTIPWVPGGTLQGGARGKAGPQQYFYRVPDLVDHLRDKLGKPLRFAPPANGFCHELHGRKGIVFFRHNLSDLVGYVRLWNGEGTLGGACRFGSETEILFWPLSSKDDAEKSRHASSLVARRSGAGARTEVPLLTQEAGYGAVPVSSSYLPVGHAY